MRKRSALGIASWAALAAAGAGAASLPPPALGAWSAPRTLAAPLPPALATDARGDVALAWSTERLIGRPVKRTEASVQVAVGGPRGPIVRRAVWQRTNAVVAGVSVALDARGELTVAWIDAPTRPGLGTGGPHMVRALYRTSAGRWSGAQAVGRASPFFYADPRLAVAPDRQVLLTWSAGIAAAPGVAQAWRSPGHRFGAATAVSRAKGAAMLDPKPLFDRGGGAHVYGTVGCNSRASRGVMVSAAPHSHRFGAPLVVAPAPARSLVVSYGGPGRALAAWLHEACSTTETLAGAPFARALRGATLLAPVALEPSSFLASSVTAVAANAGGGSVSWIGSAPMPAIAGSPTATCDASGRCSRTSVPAGAPVPCTRDGSGNVLLAQLGESALPQGPALVSPIAAQPIAGGAPQPSPVSLPRFARAVSATAQPLGAGIAVAWPSAGRLAVASWRP